MADYIKRQAAIDAFYPVDPENDGSDGCTIVTQSLNLSSAEIESILCEIPAANVREDVHGEWEWMGPCRDAAGKMWATCSACKVRQRLGDYDSFCPNCGARMGCDGE